MGSVEDFDASRS